jgi:hypothetical protein
MVSSPDPDPGWPAAACALASSIAHATGPARHTTSKRG